MIGYTVLGIGGLIFAVLSRSMAITIDGVFSLISLVMTLLAMRVARLANPVAVVRHVVLREASVGRSLDCHLKPLLRYGPRLGRRGRPIVISPDDRDAIGPAYTRARADCRSHQMRWVS